jgi:hypothetical protein
MPWLLALAVLLALIPAAPAQIAHAAGNVAMPFAAGRIVRIIQGYNGGTHQGRSQYGLDLTLADGKTDGAEVVSPIDGTVSYATTSGNGCIAIMLKDESFTVMMCHVKLSRAFTRGEAVTQGQSLGTVGVAGTFGNNGVAHVHFELHTGNKLSSPVPFAEPTGLLLEGQSLPASSTTAVTSKLAPIASTNGRGSAPAPVTAKTDVQVMSMSQPVQVSVETAPAAVQSVPAAAASTSGTTATRKAVVNGTGDCLNVRKSPSATAAVVGCLKEGSEVAVKPLAAGADAKWRQTDNGWVSSEFLKRSQAVVSGTGDCLNVREAAKASSAKLGCLPDGTAVTIAEGPTTADGLTWFRIEAAGSVEKSGWVVGKYLD